MGTRSQPTQPRSSGRGDTSQQSVLESFTSKLPSFSVTRIQTRAVFFAALLLMSMIAPFAPIGSASAASSDIALVAASSDGSQVVFMDENGGEIKTAANPLTESIDSIDVADDEFVISYHNQTDATAEVGVYDFDMNQQWFDGTPNTANSGVGIKPHITDDGSSVLWNGDGFTTIYDDTGGVVAEPSTESTGLAVGDDVFAARGPSSSDIVHAYDYTGTEQWSIDVVAVSSVTTHPRKLALKEGDTRSEDELFVNQGELVSFNPTEDSELWVGPDNGGQRADYFESNDVIVTGDVSTDTTYVHDAGTGVEIASTTTGGNRAYASANNGLFVTKPNPSDIQFLYGDNYENRSTVTTTTTIGHVSAVTSWEYTSETTGTVEDQNGNAVPGATVEVWAVDNSTVSGTTYDDRVAELDEIANDPLPDAFEQQGANFDVAGAYENQSNLFPLVHREEAYTEQSNHWFDSGTEISNPAVQVEPGEVYQVSVWDPEKESEAAGLTNPSPPVDGEFSGATTSGDVTVERISPTGEVTDSYTGNTTERFRTSTSVMNRTLKTHETMQFAFDEGVYRVSVVGSSAEYYVIAGDPGSVAESIRQSARDEQGALTARSDMIQQRLTDGEFVRTTVEADENGEFRVAVPPRYDAVKMQAYTDTGGLVSDVDLLDMSVDDLQSQYENAEDYNGSVYLPGEIETVNPPENDVTVETIEVTNPKTDLEGLLGEVESLEELLNEYSLSELESLFNDPSETVDSSELQDRYDTIVVGLIEGTPLEQAFATLAEENGVTAGIDSNHDRATMEAQLAIAEEVISTSSTSNDPPGDDGVTVDTNDDGTVTVDVPTDGDLDDSRVTVIIGDDNGTSTVIPDENVTENGNTIGDDTIEVDLGFNASDLTKTVEVVTVNEETGDVERETQNVRNPAFDGEVPTIESVNANTLRPATGDQVTIDAAGGDKFRAVTGATVYGPSGSSVPVTVQDNGDVQFTPETAGAHTVQLDMQSTSGHNVTETVGVKAVEERKDMPPTVRQASGPTGSYAVASDGVSSARIETGESGETIDVTARFADGEVPDGEVHVQGLSSQYAAQNFNVRVTDETGSTISDAVRVAIHTRDVGDGAHIRVDGDAVPVGSQTGAGEVERAGGGLVIHTVAENGGVDVSVDNNPGILDRISWFIDTTVPGMPLTINTGGLFVGFVGMLTVGGKRRRESRVTGGSNEVGQ